MGMLLFAFACLVQLMVLRTGDCYTLLPTYPSKTDYKPGESVSIRCQGTSTADENLQVYFLKVGQNLAGPGETINYPPEQVIVATFGEIEADIEEYAPGRFTTNGSHSATEFDYTYTISGLIVNDFGNYSCGAKLPNTNITASPEYAQVKVLGPVTRMVLLYDEYRHGLIERNDTDTPDKTRYDETEKGKIGCCLDYSTSPLRETSMTLHDRHTKASTNETSLFFDTYGHVRYSGDLKLFGRMHRTDCFMRVAFLYKDSGKTLKCTAKIDGYDEYEVATELDIGFRPKETYCYPRTSVEPKAPVGTKQFTLLCYTRAVPEATVTWKANGAVLRQGIIIHTENIGRYTVSVLTIDEVRESDFTSYSFETTNDFGTVAIPGDESVWELKKGTEVIQAPDIETTWYLPWNRNPSKASAMSMSGTLLVFLVASALLY